MRKITCVSLSEFFQHRHGAVKLVNAPDGLPWITHFKTPPSAATILADAAHVFSLRNNAPDFAGTPLHEITQSLDNLIKGHYWQDIKGPDNVQYKAVILPKPVRSFTGDTIFERILHGGLISRARSMTSSHAVIQAATNAAAVSESQILKFKTGDACLAFPEDEEHPIVVYMTHDTSGWPSYSFRRRFLPERLETFPDAFIDLRLNGHSVKKLLCSDENSYIDRRKNSVSESWHFCVSRLLVGEKVLEVAKVVSKLHSEGEIHADIKPSNLVLDDEAVHLIDSLCLKEGTLSPALTRGWAAPEQIMGSEVSRSTDQFPIGLMLMDLVDGVLFGEEATIAVPAGGKSLLRHTIFRNPGIFIDPNNGSVAKEHLRSWQRLIERCLRFSPAERFPSMADLAAELDALLQKKSLSGTREFPLHFGQLMIGVFAEGVEMPCWVV